MYRQLPEKSGWLHPWEPGTWKILEDVEIVQSGETVLEPVVVEIELTELHAV